MAAVGLAPFKLQRSEVQKNQRHGPWKKIPQAVESDLHGEFIEL
jgi:hypothetical protein